MQLTPTIAVHMSAAIAAVVIGPFALWARLGKTVRPRWHRALGYAWVTCMLGAAITSLFIRDFRLLNVAGFTPIHLLIPLTLATLSKSFKFLYQGDITGHRKAMQSLYVSACIVAGGFTLLPGRYLGNLLWQ